MTLLGMVAEVKKRFYEDIYKNSGTCPQMKMKMPDRSIFFDIYQLVSIAAEKILCTKDATKVWFLVFIYIFFLICSKS